jgi:NADH-quinone oxidoreductase subunit M
MILLLMIIIVIAGGILAFGAARISDQWPRWICLTALLIQLALGLTLLGPIPASLSLGKLAAGPGTAVMTTLDLPWITPLGIRLHLAVDGLSLMLVLLTGFLAIAALVSSWSEIAERAGFFHLNLMLVTAGILGVFMSLDLILFYFFWELMLVPMYFLIAVWGHENRIYAAVKFFLFTQLSGLLMLAAILGLYFIHGRHTGTYTFDYLQLLGTDLAPRAAFLLMLGFFIAFAVKLPVIFFHTWLPDAHTQAPTAGSVILAGLLLKTGAYGLIRFVIPLFPQAAAAFSPVAMGLGVVAILYGALLAFAQQDLKRLVAYTSVSHMGFILMGVFAWNQVALQGTVMTMLAHGVSTGALFILVGIIQERLHTRDLSQMGGFQEVTPRLSAAILLFAMASLGLPGLGNFVGEFLVLLGSYRINVTLTCLAALGLITSVVYAVWIVQKVVHGPVPIETDRSGRIPADFNRRELAVTAILAAAIVWLGLYPNPVFKLSGPALDYMKEKAALSAQAPVLERDNGLQTAVLEIQKGNNP